MTWNWLKKASKNSKKAEKTIAVKRSADAALTTYAKTFRDLANYDRGETTFSPVSR